MNIIKMTDLNLTDKRVLIRSDLNVPIKNGKVTSDTRIRFSLPTIECALKKNARVMITSHFGRPTEGEYNAHFSLKPIVDYLKNKFHIPVRLSQNYLNGVNVEQGELVVLENVRFNKGENKNDENLAKKYAALCDIFVMDAFGTAHRTQASTHAISKFASTACIGPLLFNEIETLNKILHNPARPMVTLVGGSKISTKLTMLNALSKITDKMIVGGGIANTFIAAQGYNIGQSLYEKDLIPEAKHLLKNCNITVPTDVFVTNEFSENAQAILKLNGDIQNDEKILDIGNISILNIINILKKAKTILWNGPVGMFELTNFRKGTEMIAHAISDSKAFSIAGGGETLAVIDLLGLAEKISYISSGGGAFLKFIEGKKLPAVVILEERAMKNRNMNIL